MFASYSAVGRSTWSTNENLQMMVSCLRVNEPRIKNTWSTLNPWHINTKLLHIAEAQCAEWTLSMHFCWKIPTTHLLDVSERGLWWLLRANIYKTVGVYYNQIILYGSNWNKMIIPCAPRHFLIAGIPSLDISWWLVFLKMYYEKSHLCWWSSFMFNERRYTTESLKNIMFQRGRGYLVLV